MKEIAVQGATLKETFTPPAPAPDVVSKQIVTPPSTKSKAEGKYVYRGQLSCSYVLTPPSGFDTPPTLPITLVISPAAQKSKADGQLIICKGDNSTDVPWSFSNAASGLTIAGTISCEIDDPGQTKAVSN
ncbi:MAG: hypothetical protein FWB73_00425 [Treponema sp.]|nr:hypothetical protein [Treponema sp.]